MDHAANHSCHLLQQLHEQRIQGLLCDCMLVVKGVRFKAHKNVLAAFSQYFRSLFQNASSQKNDVFHLDIKNIGGIGQILDFMYTSHLDLNNDNVQVMLDVAQCLQVQNVLSMCYSFLKLANPVEPASSTPCSGPLSLPSTCPGVYSNPISNQQLSPPLLQDIVTEERHSNVVQTLRETAPLNEVSKAALTPLNEMKEIQLKHLNQPYKLRDFYSKLFYKEIADKVLEQAAAPSLEQAAALNLEEAAAPTLEQAVSTNLEQSAGPNLEQAAASANLEQAAAPSIEQATAPNMCMDQNAIETQPWDFNHSAPILEPSKSLSPLPLEPLPAFSHTFVTNVDSEHSALKFPEQMQLKKAVHLKKLNMLRSQKAAEGSSQPENALQSTTESVCSGEKVLEARDRGLLEKESASGIFESLGDTLAPAEGVISTNKHYFCDICGKGFRHPSNLEQHKRSHTGEKPFECSICGKHFSQAGNLQTHLRRHTGEKPYICEICGKRFTFSADVQRHIVIHTGKKPHLCDICGRGFSNVSNLKEHEKIHVSDKIYTCDECGKSFNMHRKLIKHRISHTGKKPYNCSTCGKKFAGSGDLQRHVRSHTGEKPYTCDICSKNFSRSAVLRHHKMTHRKAAENDQNAPDKPPNPTSLEKSQNMETLTQGTAATLIPDPCHSVENTRTEGGTISTYCKLPTIMHQHELNGAKKLTDDQGSKPHAHCYTFPEVEVAEVEVAMTEENLHSNMIRSSLVALDNCAEPAGNRAASNVYKNTDAPLYTSMTLWGLSMKTLQNESEPDQ
ncbi:hypothetical protein XELAEV_18005119mg [Xenopus laevis]|uniref:Zinc finger and BTB domain-containing protein 49 n=1 Tax=Xenopus laevis TaxID=8355 RepID=A0A974DYT9_XENLA|nr:hypothetical protein XELAEV_18005119mg [Xenopus laevis]